MSRSGPTSLLLLLVLACGDDSDPGADDDDETSSSSGNTTASSAGTTGESTTSSAGDTSSSAGDTSSSRADESSSDADASTSDGETSSDGGDTELDCLGVFECLGACPDEDDDACVEACLSRGSEETLVLVEDVLLCAESNACADEDCLAEDCPTELLACAGEVACDGTGKPELTGPIEGLQASYAAGDPITIEVAVDEDTARVAVGVYEVGSTLYLGGTADDVDPSSTSTFELFAGVADGATGEFYLSIELCSTTTCTTPHVRNTYQRADRTIPLEPDETYLQTREFVGEDAVEELCPSAIPIQTFLIE